jgi:hypothetical protein
MAACGACHATRSKNRGPCGTSGGTSRVLTNYVGTMKPGVRGSHGLVPESSQAVQQLLKPRDPWRLQRSE